MRENLINARKAKKLTQAEVAKKIGILVTSYQNIEYGQRNGSIETWDKLEDLLGVSQRQLRETELHQNETPNESG